MLADSVTSGRDHLHADAKERVTRQRTQATQLGVQVWKGRKEGTLHILSI